MLVTALKFSFGSGHVYAFSGVRLNLVGRVLHVLFSTEIIVIHSPVVFDSIFKRGMLFFRGFD